MQTWTSDRHPKRKRRNPFAQAVRGLLEMLVLVLIAWSLLRTFEVESFAIPTGSMAPTLQGNHYQVTCPECAFEFPVGAAIENDGRATVVDGTCPICRLAIPIDRRPAGAHQFAAGDSIMVSKFSYRLAQPRRWDVVVFKNPYVPKINFVKRLIGLPNELIRIQQGDVYVSYVSDGITAEPRFRIARKPPATVRAMLHLVDDTRHIPQKLLAAGWPSRWQEWSGGDDRESHWKWDGAGRFAIDGCDSPVWIRYHHFVADADDWQTALQDDAGSHRFHARPQLITDYLAYNDFRSSPGNANRFESQGLHWVGDLGLECDIAIRSDTGLLLLDLVEGGVHFRCQINVQNGLAELSAEGDGVRWEDGTQVPRTARTPCSGRKAFQLRLANVDDQVLLWVDDELVAFDKPTTYFRTEDVVPKWTRQDPLDLAPAGIGSDGAALMVNRLRVLRDVYYVATNSDSTSLDYQEYYTEKQIRDVFQSPNMWSHNPLFESRRTVEFQLADDEFFPLGDNSQFSQDARYWHGMAVQRDFLIGKAVLIYWPRGGESVVPNFARMKLVR